MMTLADFKARTSAGTNPKRSNPTIQKIDAALALYEAMDATMSLKERRELAHKIFNLSSIFLHQDRIISSKKKAGVRALHAIAGNEWQRHCDELHRRATQRRLLAMQLSGHGFHACAACATLYGAV